MRYIKKYSVKEWNRFDIDTQEILCTKYNVTLTDFLTVDEIKIAKKKATREKQIRVIKRIGHIGGVIALQSYLALKAYNSKPVKKRKRKRKSKKDDPLFGLTGKS